MNSVLSPVTFENGLFIVNTRVVSYDFIYFLIMCLILAGCVLIGTGLVLSKGESAACGVFCLGLALFMFCFTPSPYTVVDAIVDHSVPWREITEKYEFLSIKDAGKNIYTFKVLETDEKSCCCECSCKK